MKLMDKPAAAAPGRRTTSFPHFVPSSLLVPVLGNGLLFAAVFCFFFLLPLCG